MCLGMKMSCMEQKLNQKKVKKISIVIKNKKVIKMKMMTTMKISEIIEAINIEVLEIY
jgi:hypothetical protein